MVWKHCLAQEKRFAFLPCCGEMMSGRGFWSGLEQKRKPTQFLQNGQHFLSLETPCEWAEIANWTWTEMWKLCVRVELGVALQSPVFEAMVPHNTAFYQITCRALFTPVTGVRDRLPVFVLRLSLQFDLGVIKKACVISGSLPLKGLLFPLMRLIIIITVRWYALS